MTASLWEGKLWFQTYLTAWKIYIKLRIYVERDKVSMYNVYIYS